MKKVPLSLEQETFKCCQHGKHRNHCKKCQIWTFLGAIRNDLRFKDVKRIIVDMILKQQPVDQVYCCRCEKGFELLSPDELDDNGYRETAIRAHGCDAEVTFRERKVIVVADEFSYFGDDGFMLTAGVFINRAYVVKTKFEGYPENLTPQQVKTTYKVAEGALICEVCINIMRWRGELRDCGGIND